MNMKRRYVWPLLVALLAGGAGYLVSRDRHPRITAAEIPPATAQATIDALLNTSFATSTGEWQKLSAWRGKILVVNYWATWCPPCREEMPTFSALHDKYQAKGVQFVGIGIDTVDKIRELQEKEKISYPLLVGTFDAMTDSQHLGNTAQALPFTVLIDRQGRLNSVKLGKLSEAELTARLQTLLAR
jgi:thiol-disulfide isomerase/thioredoxin